MLSTRRFKVAQDVHRRYPHAEGKNAIIALVLSLFIVGVGQFYNGDAKIRQALNVSEFFGVHLMDIFNPGWRV